MQRKHYYNPWLLLVLFHLFFALAPVHATVTVLDYWRLGENDPGAAAGKAPPTTIDLAGTNNLTFGGPGTALYSSDVSTAAVQHAYSSLSVLFTNSAFASNSIVSTVVDNFGMEAWVKPVSVTNGQTIIYNGGTGGANSTGWGITLASSNYAGLYGGRTTIGSGPAVAGVWTHVALVRNAGTCTLYVNGVAFGTSTGTPATPMGNFAIGASPQSPTSGLFTGWVDEVRVFTFAAGAFSTNDLLLNQPPSAFTSYPTNLVEGPAAGTDRALAPIEPQGSSWSVSSTVNWLHLTNASGIGNATVSFNFDANPGPTRTGYILGLPETITVMQAGTNNIAVTTSTLVSTGLHFPFGVAVDGLGNIYIADHGDNAIKELKTNSLTLNTLVSAGLSSPYGVAADSAGNVYIADLANNAIKEWVAASNVVTTLVSSGLNSPYGAAIDALGNIYIADTGNNAIKEWLSVSQTLTTLVSTGLSSPTGVALDNFGNVYIADNGNNAIKEWSVASNTVSTVVSSGLSSPYGVAVDGAGNLYIADNGNGAVKKWDAISQTLTNLPFSGLNSPTGVAVDSRRNVYVVDYATSVVQMLPRSFVDPMPKFEPGSFDSDSLPIVGAPPGINGVLYPVSDQSWLTVTGVTNGMISYNVAASTTPTDRTAHLTVLGEQISVTQLPGLTLSITNLLEGFSAGQEVVPLYCSAPTNAWTCSSTNVSWLHIVAGFQSGDGSTNIGFSFDANPGATRTGILTIGGGAVAVTQLSSNYVRALAVDLTAGISGSPSDTAPDNAGNVYIAGQSDNTLKEWNAATQTITNLISGLDYPYGVVSDSAGNAYVANGENVTKWIAAAQTSTNLFSAPFPFWLAMDNAGNIYMTDGGGNSSVQEWSATSQTLNNLYSPNNVNFLWGLAVDNLGNVFICALPDGSMGELNATTHQMTDFLYGDYTYNFLVADHAGHFFTSAGAETIQEWNISTKTTNTTFSTPANFGAVSVDNLGNIYLIGHTNQLWEIPNFYMDGSARTEPGVAGTDSVSLAPATTALRGILTPTTDQPWLAVTGVTNGAINFAFTPNTGLNNRVGHINVAGVSITVTQAFTITPPVLSGVQLSHNGGFQFSFTNQNNLTFNVLVSTNLALPLASWTVIGTATNLGGGVYQFASPAATNSSQMFYRISSP